MPKRHLFATIALVVAATCGFAAPASAHNQGGGHRDSDHHGHHHEGDGNGGVTIVADNLNNPRQIAVHDGAIYVAEAGTGGDICPPGTGACIGFTGSVTRVKHHHQERVQTGLLSVASPEGDIVGVDSLAFKGSKLYGVVTGACIDPTTLPPDIAAQLGKVLRLNGGTDATAVADPGSFECANDPDGQGPDTDPYGLAIRGRSLYVADAAGNDVVKFHKNDAPVATVISKTSQPVPTSLTWGPGGDLYIGTLNFEGGPGAATVYRLDVHTGALSVYATGLTAITSLAFGSGGRLYVTEWTTGFGPHGPLPDGDVVSIPCGGGLDGRQGHRCRCAALPHRRRGCPRRRVRVQLGHRHRYRRSVRAGQPRSAGEDQSVNERGVSAPIALATARRACSSRFSSLFAALPASLSGSRARSRRRS